MRPFRHAKRYVRAAYTIATNVVHVTFLLLTWHDWPPIKTARNPKGKLPHTLSSRRFSSSIENVTPLFAHTRTVSRTLRAFVSVLSYVLLAGWPLGVRTAEQKYRYWFRLGPPWRAAAKLSWRGEVPNYILSRSVRKRVRVMWMWSLGDPAHGCSQNPTILILWSFAVLNLTISWREISQNN